YALRHLGRMSRGERVLIHAAAGGVGLAAVQIAQQVGAEVFATAGSSEKRAFLSALGVRHVMDSRSLSFADEIREITGGQGVDLVLNSLAGEAIPKGLSCLAPYGRFLEIGKRDIYQNSKLGLRTFKKNLSFFALDLSQVIADRPELINRQFGELMQLFEEKQLHPLPYRVFPLSDVVNAFRHMAQARHIGKIVISLRNQEIPVEPLADQTLSFRPNATYLITGGLGGFGLAVAQWMVENGARHLVLMGRSGVTSDEARQAVQAMEAKGGQIVVARGDVSREEDVARLLSEIEQSLPPLRGIAHAAMVVDDGILLRLDRERFKKVMEPKVQGAWNLHRLTLNKPLDFFLLFSSVATIVGSPGQGNYAAANAFLDALAHHRRLQNLPALSINWGHLADTGYVARHKEIGEHLDSIGIKGFTSKQAVEILGRLLLKQSVQVGVVNADWRQWAKYGSVPLRFSLLVSPEVLDQQRDEGSSRLRDRVLASQLDQRPSLIESYLKDQVARVLGTSASRLESERPLSEMGLDSLMMVELRNKIERELGVSLPAVELMRGPSISTLSQVLLDQLTGFDAASRKHLEPEIQRRRSSEIDAQAAEELVQRIDQLSGEEVDALLTQLIDEGELSTLVTEQNKPAVNSQPSAKAEG
ncbi:MAG: type I polyketide synthase, partial [candidate division WOR-3 bacterium]